jgi:hypothetical protein
MRAGLRKMKRHQLSEATRRCEGVFCDFLESELTVAYDDGTN